MLHPHPNPLPQGEGVFVQALFNMPDFNKIYISPGGLFSVLRKFDILNESNPYDKIFVLL
jgi:hypothetical protein